MKTFIKRSIFFSLAAGVTLLTPARATAAENAYDQLGAFLAPVARVFTPQGEDRALKAVLVLESMTGLPPEQTGGRLEVTVEPPSRARLKGRIGEREVVLTRMGQTLWLEPTELAGLFSPGKAMSPKKRKKAKGLDPLVLPFPPAQLALLPVLFHVTGLPTEADGSRTLEVKLMRELAENLARKHPEARAEEWVGRLTLHEGRLTRLQLARPGWQVTVRVEMLELLKALPPGTWAEPKDAVRLEGPDARRWLNGVGKRLNEEGKRLNRD